MYVILFLMVVFLQQRFCKYHALSYSKVMPWKMALYVE